MAGPPRRPAVASHLLSDRRDGVAASEARATGFVQLCDGLVLAPSRDMPITKLSFQIFHLVRDLHGSMYAIPWMNRALRMSRLTF